MCLKGRERRRKAKSEINKRKNKKRKLKKKNMNQSALTKKILKNKNILSTEVINHAVREDVCNLCQSFFLCLRLFIHRRKQRLRVIHSLLLAFVLLTR
jgi:hypothetical protein